MDTPVLPIALAIGFALPWWIVPALLRRRMRTTPSLDDVADAIPERAPRVSIILPARNEAKHIAGCIASLRASTWSNLEIIVVDDHSTDGTGELARQAAGEDPRVRIVDAPDLPPGWFGKQWACQSGAAHATGTLLLFTDADTRHAPDLVTRAVNMRARRKADLFSVAGRQDMHTIWEQAVQPSVFTLILTRYGGADHLERAKDRRDVVANGQCFLITRELYDRLGGHDAVKSYVAEDVMMAQAVLEAGGVVSMALGIHQLRTHMYDGLASLVKGWSKNIFAGGRHAMWGGEFERQYLYPILLLTFPLLIVTPFIGLAVSAVKPGIALLTWAIAASIAVLVTFAQANRINDDPLWRAIYAPLGGFVLLGICIKAVVSGNHVEWKGRAYRSS